MPSVLRNVAPISAGSAPGLAYVESYGITLSTDGGNNRSTVRNASDGDQFSNPVDNIGSKTFGPVRPLYGAITIVSSEDAQALWVIDASLSDKKIRVTATNPPAINENQDHQLWLAKPDDGSVQSLGLFPNPATNQLLLMHRLYRAMP